jgi:hypothetical protein
MTIYILDWPKKKEKNNPRAERKTIAHNMKKRKKTTKVVG